MELEQVIATWISFMTTAVRSACGLSRSQFVILAQKYKLIPFLAAHYELLHYYDNDYVVDDVIRFVHEQGGAADELSRIS
ncbi:DUF3791 domain-containing protein [Treponema primitia]|uniref:DUF3791 domain-containing protein n=1 Tax=Treponema primitia TaxID=88058 RepID=UPI00025556DC|nr:DUF3791 domain-containing protein [Treponema primitia]